MRPLARRALALVREGSGGAVELGSGAGIEARFLAENGVSVHTYDGDRSVAPAMADLARTLPITHTTADLSTLRSLPAADLVLSCATLSFVPRTAFRALWGVVRSALRPGGVLAVDLFGDRDDWAGTEGTFLRRDEVEDLLDGLEVLELVEEERDGRSFSGPKHWHTFRVLARR
ncbi:class I SAM-dependent methyltransferase [Brachybacterium vulturis]|uniref:class I SAM-dependent methyltransferase n=1 Tax=Brachybacterium vulturis TaxID=2017484 RepID=UPI001FEB2297|nr:methyltransferase domain-containing protein [Brachybacterium vulturis]